MTPFKLFHVPEDDFFAALRRYSPSQELLGAVSILGFDFQNQQIMSEIVNPLVELLASSRVTQVLSGWKPTKLKNDLTLLLRNEAARSLVANIYIPNDRIIKGLSDAETRFLPTLITKLVLMENSQIHKQSVYTDSTREMVYSQSPQEAYIQMLVTWMGLLHISDPRFRKYEMQPEIMNKWYELRHLLAGMITGINRILDREPPSTLVSQATQVIKCMPEPQKSSSMKYLIETISQETMSRAHSMRQLNDLLGKSILPDLYTLLGEASPQYRHQVQESIKAIEKWACVQNGNWSKDQLGRFYDQYALFVSEREPSQFWMLKLTVPEGVCLDPVVRNVLNRMHSQT